MTRKEGGEVDMITVMDLGQRTSTRRKGKGNEWKIVKQQEDKIEDKEDNKHEDGMEAAKIGTPGRKSRSMKMGIMKMTTPRKVKTASPCPRMSGRKESPRNRSLKRLNQQTLLNMKPRMILDSQTADNSKRNFTSLLSRWENICNSSNIVLTSAFQDNPRSKQKTDGQSQDVLQNTSKKFGQAPNLLLDAKVGKLEVLQSRTNEKPRDKNLKIVEK